MRDLKGVYNYWQEQTQKGDNPCHYHNQWQDAYAFRVRTGAFKKQDFAGLTSVVDIGCGIGEYMAFLSHQAPQTRFIGFDFPFNIEIAKARYANQSQLEFHAESLPHPTIAEAIRQADAVLTTTVYVHLAPEARRAFYEYIGQMHSGAKVFLLEYAPDTVPEFQKNLEHKIVETPLEIGVKMKQRGFDVADVRHVNYIDSFLFFHFGKNALSYYATLALEYILRLIRYSHSKYKLMIFQKQ